MSDVVSFNLFGEGGFINPTKWSYADGPDSPGRAAERWLVPFYDHHTGQFRQRQAADFDGGWRWYDEYEGCALCIYNKMLDPRAYFHLTHIEMANTLLTPECLLLWAKSMVLVDHHYYVSKNWLEDHIRALARKATIEIKKEIHGDDSPHLRSVR